MKKAAAAKRPRAGGNLVASKERRKAMTFRGAPALFAKVEEVLALEQKGDSNVKLAHVLEWMVEHGLELYWVLRTYGPHVQSIEYSQGMTRGEALKYVVEAGCVALFGEDKGASP